MMFTDQYLNTKAPPERGLAYKKFTIQKDRLGFLQNRHPCSLCLYHSHSAWNAIQRSAADVACKEVDRLATTILEGHILAMEVVSLTLGIFIGVRHFFSPPSMSRR